SHIPMLLDPDPKPYGTLLCHVARDNPQWRHAGEGESLAIFLGPDAYVSPSTYASKARNPRVVPTWNYVAIHAYGRLQWFDDEARLRDLVSRLTQRQEASREKPWAVDDAPDDYVRGMLRAIIGLALPITRLEGKWKMSQNRPPEDRVSAAAALTRDGNEDIASLITGASRRQALDP
ncbi:MAG TPA: FMN-binding negative transcriptional regulator, partial [Stellaceae bacterium]|nr:FMN-binding negative transcriptional regulator [Stellaceae bacterium]